SDIMNAMDGARIERNTHSGRGAGRSPAPSARGPTEKAAPMATSTNTPTATNCDRLATKGLELRLNRAVAAHPSTNSTEVISRPGALSHGRVRRSEAIPSAIRMGVAILHTT